MKTVVVYQSKTGFTKKYAEWIAQELGCLAIPDSKEMKELSNYQTILYGGGIMAGKISGFESFKNKVKLQEQKLIVFTTGATSDKAIEVIEQIKKNNLSEEEQKKIPFFYYEGGIDYEAMSFMNRFILKQLYKMLNKKKEKTAEEKGMEEAISKSFDHTDRIHICDLIKVAKQGS